VSLINLGSWELVLIMLFAILAIGPKRMVQIVRTVQRWAAQARRISGQLMSTLQAELDAAEDLKTTAREAAQAVEEIKREVADTMTKTAQNGQTLADTARQATEAIGGLKKDLEKAAKPAEDKGNQTQQEDHQ
jgi:sec-independent protein translocase protein TatB